MKLQRSLYDAYHHRLDRKDAKTQTIGDFLKGPSVRNGIMNLRTYILRSVQHSLSLHCLENSRNEYSERIESLKKAWDLVGSDLRTHSKFLMSCYILMRNESIMSVCNTIGRLPLEDQHCLPAITKDTSLEYLIPTTSGAGALTTALVDYLILTHNDFIEKSHSKAAEKSQG